MNSEYLSCLYFIWRKSELNILYDYDIKLHLIRNTQDKKHFSFRCEACLSRQRQENLIYFAVKQQNIRKLESIFKTTISIEGMA